MKSTKSTSMKAWMGVVLAGGLMASGLAQAEFDRASMLANTCVGCHGVDGISSGPAIPSIAGLSELYFTDTMKAYRDGSRPSTIMTRIAKGYSDQDIEDMAKYFANLEYVQVEQEHDKKHAAIGKKLHKSYCDRCHDSGGTVAEDDAGFLVGQMKPYLEYSLADFTSGDREMERKMKQALDKLEAEHGEAGLKVLIEYYASGKK